MKESFGTVITATGRGVNALTTAAEKWFISRGIDPETVINCGIYTDQGGALVFPFLEGGIAVNEKFRRKGKAFSQRKDGKRTFWNWQGLEIAVLENQPLVICEGEMDALTAIECGYPWVVSVPDGAPSKKIDFYGREEDQKFKFIWNNETLLNKIKTFILAGDNDEPGKVLNHELQNRLGAERCKFVSYPEGCKDLNDVLMNHNKQTVLEVIHKARDYPVVGLCCPDEFPPIPQDLKTPYKTGLGWNHDDHLKIMLGKFMVVTGIPGHGKSEWADGLVMSLAKIHDWKICVCSTEIDNEEYEENSIRRLLRRPLDQVGDHEQEKAKKFYRDHFVFITNNTMNEEIELTIEKLIDLAEIAILRHSCKVLLLDPWNEIEHKRNRDETETDYTGRAIRMLKKLARQYHILVIIVAHPSKPFGGKVEAPSLYNISGSANWANKADYGLVLYRDDLAGTRTTLKVNKIKRHGHMGRVGDIEMSLNKSTGWFEELRL